MQRLAIDNINNVFLLMANNVLIFLQNVVIESLRIILFRSRTCDLGARKKNILVLKTGGLGDFLFGVPAFKLLRNACPDDKVVLLTQIAFGGKHLLNLRARGLLQIPWIELVADMFEGSHIIGDLSVESIVRLRKDLQPHTFDTVILMPSPGEPLLSAAKRLLLLKLLGLGSCQVYGIHQNYSLSYLRRFHVRWGLAVHKIYGPWRAVEAFLRKKHTLTHEYLKLDGIERFSKEDAIALLQRESIITVDYIVISPGSSAEWKSWGQTNFKNLIENLAPVLSKKNIAIVIAGPLSDSVLAGNLKCAPSVFDICGRYSMSELATIHQHSLCSIAVDGGAAHLAAFSGATVISLSNGGEEPGIVTPVGPNVTEHRNHTDCTPCFGMTSCPLGHSKCIVDIPVQEVFDSVMAVVASR